MNEGINQGHYKFEKVLGSGSFGKVWLALEVNSGEKVAVKLENTETTNPQLQGEYNILHRYLRNVEGFPWVRHFGQTKGNLYFVMQLLGPSLQDMLDICGGTFSLKTTLMLADQVISRIESLHKLSGFVSRDIKPENLLMGREDTSEEDTLFMIDLGLARPYRDQVTGFHIAHKVMQRGLVGTARYASINAHHGAEQSRRDDLESAGYVLVYFLKGKLPWQGIKAATKKERNETICHVKKATTSHDLCHGIPNEFVIYINYCRGLRFEEEPDYSYLKYLFKGLMNSMGYAYDNDYDWVGLASTRESPDDLSFDF